MQKRPIPGYKGVYSITDDGRVWSEERIDNRGHRRGGHWMRLSLQGGPYLRLTLRVEGLSVQKFVHQLVLETFVGPCPEGMECCHNNGDPTDNRLANLRWDTPSANQRDAVKHGTQAGLHSRGERNGYAKLTERDVGWIRYWHKSGVMVKDLAEWFSVCVGNIHMVVSRKTWDHIKEV